MMLRRFGLLALLALIATPAFAQQQYFPGGIAKVHSACKTTVAGDTQCPDGSSAASPQITAPALPANQVRGTGSGTDNAAHTIIASAGGSLKNYITSMQCSNTSSTTTTITTNDSASSVFIVPAVGGTNLVFPVPLVTAAATAFTFTAATGVTTMTCNAQGYTGT